jgi:putative MATE family efflux protein
MMALAEPALRLMGAEADVLPLGTTYMRAAAAGLGFQSIIFASSAALRGTGDTRTPMVIAVVANAINIVLDYVLISGFLWAPKMGVLGSGVAFSVANTVGALMILYILARGRGFLKYGPSDILRVSRKGLRRILAVGLPTGIEQMQFMVAFMLYARIISGLGTASFAAHTVALRAEALAIMPGFALGIAAATLVGQSLGAGRVRSAERAASLTHLYAMIFMLSVGVVLFAFAPWVTRVFTNDPEIVDIGADLLRIFAFALPGLGTSASLAGGLRGAGDTRAVLGIYTASAWLIRIPLALFLALPMGMGAQGAWIGSVVDNTVRGSAIWWRFRRGRWKDIHV